MRLLGFRDRIWLAGLAAALLLVMADVFIQGPLVRLDLWVGRFHGTQEWPPLREFSIIYDKVGQRSVTIPILLIVAGTLGRKHRTWRPVLLSLWLVLILNVVVGGMKIVIGRAKPSTESVDVFTGGVIFPSGHSSNMVLTGGLILYLLNRYADRPPLKVLTVVIAAMTTMTVLVSLYRRTHWLTDLVAGALVGGLLLQAIIVMDRATATLRQDRQFWLDHPRLLWILGRTQFEGERADIAAGGRPLSSPLPSSVDREGATQADDPDELAAAAVGVRISESTDGSVSRLTLGETVGTTKRNPGLRTWLQEARSGADLDAWTHARSYVGLSPANFAHRARLKRLRSLLRQLDLDPRGLAIDLGCSDGFIVSELRRNEDLPAVWRVAGYDCVPRLLQAARRRGLHHARFRRIDLNDATARVARPGKVVLCLETLEHVGDYRSALQVLHNAMKPGAWLILSMPNEVGLVGLVKFLTRPILRRNVYAGFFSSHRQVLRYTLAVATYRDLEPFRTPPRSGWAPHLGFDHRQVKRHIRREFVDRGLWTTERVSRSAFGANHILVIRRTNVLELRTPSPLDTEKLPGGSRLASLAPVAALTGLSQIDLETLGRGIAVLIGAPGGY